MKSRQREISCLSCDCTATDLRWAEVCLQTVNGETAEKSATITNCLHENLPLPSTNVSGRCFLVHWGVDGSISGCHGHAKWNRLYLVKLICPSRFFWCLHQLLKGRFSRQRTIWRGLFIIFVLVTVFFLSAPFPRTNPAWLNFCE